MKRRSFIKNSFFTTIGLGLFSGLYSWKIEPFWLEFVSQKMPIKNLPEQLIGKTLMQISDIHVGNRFDYNYIIDSFKKAQKLNPDIVVYTGDYVSYENEEQFTQLTKVLKHAAKGKLGTCGILGNHDYGKNWSEQHVADTISNILEKSDIRVLKNDHLKINNLNIIGLDDYWGLNFNPEKAIKNINTNEANLVLCHNPDVCDLDIWNNYKGWILAGHTHGGQVKPPFLPPLILPVKNKKYSSGKISLKNGRTLYINRALGHLWQIRCNVRPEITIFTLEKEA